MQVHSEQRGDSVSNASPFAKQSDQIIDVYGHIAVCVQKQAAHLNFNWTCLSKEAVPTTLMGADVPAHALQKAEFKLGKSSQFQSLYSKPKMSAVGLFFIRKHARDFQKYVFIILILKIVFAKALLHMLETSNKLNLIS